MSFCLDDGEELLYGPASGSVALDEPATAILHSTAAPGEAPTRAQIHTTEQTAVLRSGVADVPKRSFDKRLLVASIVLAVVILGGFFGYKYFTPNKQIESIAVMPFVNESGNADVEYLSDGMTETLISSLSGLSNLDVKPRSAVFRYKGKETDPQTIGNELHVQALLNGRLTQRGKDLSLYVELIDVARNKAIWSETYNRKQSDLVTLQGEIARDVSKKLMTKLSGVDQAKITRNTATNTEAYQFYLKGLFYWNKRTADSLKKSIDYFDQAVQKDPNYALAYGGMALAYVLLPQYSAGSADESIPKGKAAAAKALALDETVAEAHTALASALFTYDRNFAESSREYQRAIELNPNYATGHQWYGDVLLVMGRYDEAIAEGKRAVELDPLSLVTNLELGTNYHYARQNDKAIAQLRKTIELDPNWYLAHMELCRAYDANRQFAEAAAECQKAQKLSDDPYVLVYLGHVYAASGKRDEATKIITQLSGLAEQRYVASYNFAIGYAGLGDKDQAFRWLERSYQDHGWEIVYLRVDPYFDGLRDDPRLRDLLKRMNLPE